MSISRPTNVDVLESLESFTSLEAHESHEFARIEAQLITTFSPPLRPAQVQQCVMDCVERYGSARVRQFLPLLIEREASQQLRELSRATSPHRE